MTKEQIEKATDEYIGYTREADEGLGTTMRRHAFMDGAQWRINSVWHDAEEEPKRNTWFIAQMELSNEDDEIFFDTFILRPEEYDNWQNWWEGFNIKRWAYIDDLLPEKNAEGCVTNISFVKEE